MVDNNRNLYDSAGKRIVFKNGNNTMKNILEIEFKKTLIGKNYDGVSILFEIIGQEYIFVGKYFNTKPNMLPFVYDEKNVYFMLAQKFLSYSIIREESIFNKGKEITFYELPENFYEKLFEFEDEDDYNWRDLFCVKHLIFDCETGGFITSDKIEKVI